jgi:hypothetical protein
MRASSERILRCRVVFAEYLRTKLHAGPIPLPLSVRLEFSGAFEHSELTPHPISGTFSRSNMTNLYPLSFPHRVIAAFAAIFLLAAPFTATCCVHLSCAPVNPTDTSSSPCHGTMTPEHPQTLDRQTPPMCTDTPFTLQSPRSEEINASFLLSSQSSVASIWQVAKACNALVPSVTRLSSSANPVRSLSLSTSLASLKL